MASTEAVATLTDVSLTVRGRNILDGVNLAIYPGEIHALLVGQNEDRDCLARILAGKLRPEQGQVSRVSPAGVVVVSGSPKVFPSLTVEDNLIASGSWQSEGRWFARHRRRQSLRKWLLVNQLQLDLTLPMYELPPGECRFVEILRHLLHSPGLLILDGALENLEAERRRQLWRLFNPSLAAGMAVFWFSDKPEDVLAYAHRVSLMRWGRILLSDPVGNIDRLNLVRLLTSNIKSDGDAGGEDSRERFYQTMRFTEAILLDIPTGVIIVDPELTVRFANRGARDLFAKVEEEGREQRLSDFMGSPNQRLFAIASGAATGEVDGDWHNLTLAAGGGDRLIDLRVRSIREGKVVFGHMLVIDDVSIREELRRRLMMAENLASVGLLAAGVAHEVNNPLEVIGNYLNFLRHNLSEGDMRDALEQIGVETKHIQQIVQNLVAFSGSANPRTGERTDLARLSRDICSLMVFQGKKKGIEFLYQGPEESQWVAAGPGEMRQMLLNLLLNSIDAMAGGGRVVVAVETPDDSGPVRFTVSDNGPGISLGRLEDVFLPFVSTKNGESHHQGLGLSIVYGIVDRAGGSISVENSPEGGCRFSLLLPRWPKEGGSYD